MISDQKSVDCKNKNRQQLKCFKKLRNICKHNKSYSEVPSKVKQFTHDKTAFGFPTILKQDEQRNKVVVTKSGVPGKVLRNDFGEMVTHDRFVENEKLIRKDNYIQRSVLLNNFEVAKKQNPNMQGAFMKGDGNKKRANDFCRVSEELLELRTQTNFFSPRMVEES